VWVEPAPALAHGVVCAAGTFTLRTALPAGPLDAWRLLIPPDAAVFEEASPGPEFAAFDGIVTATTFRGSVFRMEVVPAATDAADRLVFEFRNRGRAAAVAPGRSIRLWVDQTQLVLVPEG